MVDYQKRFAEFPAKVQKFSIIQGTADETVDWKYNIKKIEEKFIGSKVYLVNGGMHHLVNESNDYREHVFSLINQLAD
jgi:alpha-beta hydrolase superfamily lysophospholipase